jgi:radical SAM protein with 4Fe4S-binding SPASM domain
VSNEARPLFGASYGPGALRLTERVRAGRVPLRGSIELTHRCNLACVHCYVNLPAADRAAQRREMTTDEVKRVLDELAELGLLGLTLTGGEPLLRPDFAELYAYAHDRGILVSVYTNATLITDRIVELWQERPPTAVDITMYGQSAEVYDRVAAAGEGQHARYRRGLERLLEAGVHVTLKTVAMRANRDEVVAMAQFAEALGCEFRLDAVLSPRIDGGRGPLAQRLSPDEVVTLEMVPRKFEKAWDEYCHVNEGAPKSDELYSCGAGINTFVIDPYGRMHPCELSRKLGWDVLRDGFAAGWFGAIPELRAQKREHDRGCGSCAAHGGCSNCTGMAELEALGADANPYFCQVADVRHQRVFGDERPQPNGLIRLRLPTERLT